MIGRLGYREDWDKVISCPLDVFIDAGTDPDEYPWVKEVYAWLYARQAPLLRKQYGYIPPCVQTQRRPPVDFMPFPLADNTAITEPELDKAQISFVKVESSKRPINPYSSNINNAESKNKALAAAEFVYDIFRQFIPDIGYPDITLPELEISGGSLALSAMIASLCRILNVEIPDNLIVTGCFDENTQTLCPVPFSTLAQKICAAVRYGYRDFILVDDPALRKNPEFKTGQSLYKYKNDKSLTKLKGPSKLLGRLKQDKIVPEDVELKFHHVSKQPFLALMKILEFLPSSGKEMAEFLIALSYQKNIWFNEQFRHILSSQRKSNFPLVKYLANILFNGCLVAKGNSKEALWKNSKLTPPAGEDIPGGVLGNYLKYEVPLLHIRINIECGIWRENDPIYEKTLRILQQKKDAIKDNSFNIEDLQSALFLANIVARHKLFRGKLKQNLKLILQAWDDLTFLHKYWPKIFKYIREQGRMNENENWQRNLCIECLESIWHLEKNWWEVLPDPELPDKLFPKFELTDDMNADDLTAWIRWKIIHSESDSISVARLFKILKKIHKDEQNRKPMDYMPYEKVLIYNLGTPKEQELARKQLERAEHLKLKMQGIMTILAMRTAYVLQGSESEKINEACEAVKEWRSLRELANELMQSPDEIIFRCPY